MLLFWSSFFGASSLFYGERKLLIGSVSIAWPRSVKRHWNVLGREIGAQGSSQLRDPKLRRLEHQKCHDADDHFGRPPKQRTAHILQTWRFRSVLKLDIRKNIMLIFLISAGLLEKLSRFWMFSILCWWFQFVPGPKLHLRNWTVTQGIRPGVFSLCLGNQHVTITPFRWRYQPSYTHSTYFELSKHCHQECQCKLYPNMASYPIIHDDWNQRATIAGK